MQASLDAEIKSRADAMRTKKKLESQLNDTEMQLDHANRNLQDQLKLVRKLQTTIKASFTPCNLFELGLKHHEYFHSFFSRSIFLYYLSKKTAKQRVYDISNCAQNSNP